MYIRVALTEQCKYTKIHTQYSCSWEAPTPPPTTQLYCSVNATTSIRIQQIIEVINDWRHYVESWLHTRCCVVRLLLSLTFPILYLYTYVCVCCCELHMKESSKGILFGCLLLLCASHQRILQGKPVSLFVVVVWFTSKNPPREACLFVCCCCVLHMKEFSKRCLY